MGIRTAITDPNSSSLLIVSMFLAATTALAQTDSSDMTMYDFMHRDGVISQSEYDHYLAHGKLPPKPTQSGEVVPHTRQSSKPTETKRKAAGRRQRRRPFARSYSRLWPDICAKVRAEAAADRRRNESRVEAAERWAEAHDVSRRQVTASGKVSVIHRIDEHGMPCVMGGDALADAQFVNAEDLWPGAGNGFTLCGSNVTVAVWETGRIRTTHDERELGSRLNI